MHGLARRFGLPAAWFKAEAEAGRLPCLRVGSRFIFNIKAVEAALAERASGSPQQAQAGLEVAHG